MNENIWDKHISVLLEELINSIDISEKKQNIIVDATLWLAWHASKMIEKMNAWDLFIWFDADIRNLELAKKRLKEIGWTVFVDSNIENKDKIKIILINSNFVNLKSELEKRWITKITWIYYDLWISSVHVDEADRWFSFRQDWPLDMRFDSKNWKTAADIVNWYLQEDLRKIFIEYWEEPLATKIAARIVERRKKEKFRTTLDLVNLIEEINNHPKTKTRVFQALRIETNNELENMKTSISDALSLLEKNWKIFVISFHSLEDRIVKQIFKKETRDCICSDIICSCRHTKSLKILSKKPILPTTEEIKHNSRSRSAKARLAEKII